MYALQKAQIHEHDLGVVDIGEDDHIVPENATHLEDAMEECDEETITEVTIQYDATPMETEETPAQVESEEEEEEPMNTSLNTTIPIQQEPTLNTDTGSRFYFTRKIVIGNVSRYIPLAERKPGLEKYAYKWGLYVKSYNDTPVESFVQKIRFHLHPDYKPYDIVQCREPPYQIWKYGWGEFPVRIQIFFVDSERNKPLDIIQNLKVSRLLFACYSIGE